MLTIQEANILLEKYLATQQRLQDLNIPLPFPSLLPRGSTIFREIDTKSSLSKFWRIQGGGQYKGLSVMASVAVYGKSIELQKLWYHVSFSRKTSIPSYTDLVWVKETFVGENRWCLQFFPEKEKHINVHNHCLHLWHCLEENPIPDLRVLEMI